MLCYHGQQRNSSVFTYSHSDSSAATSSATRKNGTVQERPCRNEEQDSKNVSKQCAVRLVVHFSVKSWIPCIVSFNLLNLLVFSHYGKTFLCLFMLHFFCVGAGTRTLMSFSDGLGSFSFRRKMEKTQLMREEMDRKVLFSSQSWHLSPL